ncbi:GntR family transcriptional regulator [Alphaproteobacteria bacterium LSUCC0684]
MELEPGQPLDEAWLTRLFGLSRTPMREVLRQLSGEGYTQILENRGAFVSPMDHKSMRNFFLTAPMIYAATSRLAAQASTPAQIDALARIQADFKDAVRRQDVDGMVYFNDRFHYQTGVIAGNTYIMPSLQRLLIDHARIGQIFWQEKGDARDERIGAASRHHDQFIEIFAAGDEDEAIRLTLEHWELSRQYMDEYIHPRPLDYDITSFETPSDQQTGT